MNFESFQLIQAMDGQFAVTWRTGIQRIFKETARLESKGKFLINQTRIFEFGSTEQHIMCQPFVSCTGNP